MREDRVDDVADLLVEIAATLVVEAEVGADDEADVLQVVIAPEHGRRTVTKARPVGAGPLRFAGDVKLAFSW